MMAIILSGNIKDLDSCTANYIETEKKRTIHKGSVMDEKKIVEPREPSALVRWLILVLVSLTVFGSYLAYDCIGPVAPMLKKILGYDGRQIGLLYSIYSVPNIVMVFIGGYVVDRIGTRLGGLLYAVTVFIGTVITALAPSLHWMPTIIMSHLPHGWTVEFAWMLVGRFIFGLGSESLIVAQSTILARWFKGHELAFAFGINLTVSRMGTFAAFMTFGWIAEHYNSLHQVFWASALFCALAVLSFIAYMLLEKAKEMPREEVPKEEQETIALRDVLHFPRSFWYISTLCFLFYSCIFPFTAFSTDFFHEKWGFDQTYASRISSIIIFFSMICTPIFGALVDRYGKRASVMVLGSLMLIPTYLVMGFTRITPIYAMSVMGIAFSLVPAAMWPSLPLLIDEKRLGSAYGLMTMLQNIGLALFPFVIGWVRDATGGYTAAMVVFSSIGCAGFVFALLLLGGERERLEKGRAALQLQA
jgi:MFS family permease